MSNVSRREMLVRLGWLVGAISGSLSVSPLPELARVRAQTAIGELFITLTPEEAETVRAIVSRLIPSDENGPGALEARADRYIDRGLAGALKASRDKYSIGLADLNSRAQIMKGRRFSSLASDDQDALLTAIEKTPAEFFDLIRTHTIQGTFGDPFYGGNANFIGWNLLGYPGTRTTVSADLQRLDKRSEPSGKSAYDYPMFSKGEV